MMIVKLPSVQIGSEVQKFINKSMNKLFFEHWGLLYLIQEMVPIVWIRSNYNIQMWFVILMTLKMSSCNTQTVLVLVATKLQKSQNSKIIHLTMICHFNEVKINVMMQSNMVYCNCIYNVYILLYNCPSYN